MPIDAEQIVQEAGRVMSVNRHFIVSPCRISLVVRARALAAIAMRELTDMSLPAIGRQLGGREASTVHELIQTYRQDDETCRDLREVARNLGLRLSETSQMQNGRRSA